MKAVLDTTDVRDPHWLTSDLLGLSVVERVAYAAMDAGASEIAIKGPHADLVQALFRDRLVPFAYSQTLPPPSELQLVIRADMLPSVQALVELAEGSSIPLDGKPAIQKVTAAHLANNVLTSWHFHSKRYLFAAPIRNRTEFKKAKQLILKALVKPTDGPISRYINRPISTRISAVLVKLRLSPDLVTVFVFAAGIVAAWFASRPSPSLQILGALFYQFHSIIDGCDGEIARLRRRSTTYGSVLDSVVDDLSNALFWLGLSIGVAKHEHWTWPYYTGLVTAVFYVLTILLQYRSTLQQTGRGDKSSFWKKKSALFSVFSAMLRRDVFIVLILLVTCWDGQKWLVLAFPTASFAAFIATWMQFRKSQVASKTAC